MCPGRSLFSLTRTKFSCVSHRLCRLARIATKLSIRNMYVNEVMRNGPLPNLSPLTQEKSDAILSARPP